MTEEPDQPATPSAEEDPLATAARAPLAHRLGGAAIFVLAAIIGISILRACREEPTGHPARHDAPGQRPTPGR